MLERTLGFSNISNFLVCEMTWVDMKYVSGSFEKYSNYPRNNIIIFDSW